MHISRRTMLAVSAALSFTPRMARAADTVSIHLDPSRRLRAIPAGYMGLGYETLSVAKMCIRDSLCAIQAAAGP